MSAGGGVGEGLILKLIGSVCGTVLALIFAPSRSRKEFKQRASFSLISGIVMTPVVRVFIEIPNDAETLVATAAVTAFASWSAAGAYLRIVKGWKSGR